ncbi:universal stress protein [Kribbella lupini]|uniref:Universal stress protein n=1 Tax=Kribbella lupini TaxID=291602 RepID=A0ABP4LGQ7_9ACTN
MSAQLARPVVVGVDGSRDGLVALTWAARFATARQAPLHGVHVVDESRHPAVPPSDCPDDGAEVLDDAADELERIGFAGATLEVRHGHPATILVGLSSRAKALVIGRRGAGGFAELVMGSTSQVCTALTRAPLVVVPDCWEPERPRHGRIVVGVDGSPGCQAALAFGFDLAEATGAEVRVVHAADVPESYPVPGLWPDPNDNAWAPYAEKLLAAALDGWSAKHPGVGVTTSYEAAHPVLLLANESRAADLVVVGGVGRTEFTPLRMGSVARGLLHHTHCPVAVIHQEETS